MLYCQRGNRSRKATEILLNAGHTNILSLKGGFESWLLAKKIPTVREFFQFPLETGNGGNALFLILIAVALFAALSYAVTQSGRGGTGGAAKEQSVLNAGQLLSHAGMLEQTINRIKLINGCTSSRISFEQSTVAGYTNAGSPADNSCHIFHTSGGGLPWLTAPLGARAAAGEQYTFFSRKIIGAGMDAYPELVMVLLVNRETCIALNNAVGQANPGGNPPVNTDATIQPPMTKFTGTFGSGNYIAGPQMGDRGCMQATSDGYWFYYPLMIDPLD